MPYVVRNAWNPIALSIGISFKVKKRNITGEL